MVFVPGSVMAIDCQEETRKVQASGYDSTYVDTTVVGIIHDSRSPGIPEETLRSLSEDALYQISTSAEWGPYLVVLEEGTNNIYRLFVLGPTGLESPESYMAPVIGRRVRMTGCFHHSEPGRQPRILIRNINDTTLLE
jgi:hypothetical protein